MNKMKMLSIVWGMIVVGIFVLLTVFGFMYKNKSSVYKELEEKLVEAEKKYVDSSFLYPEEKKTQKITAEELISKGFMDELKVNDEICEGYAVVSHETTVFTYKGYVKCKNYTTKGYKNQFVRKGLLYAVREG